MKTFAEMVEEKRLEKRVTILELSKIAGRGRSSILSYLSGEWLPELEPAVKIAKALDFNLADCRLDSAGKRQVKKRARRVVSRPLDKAINEDTFKFGQAIRKKRYLLEMSNQEFADKIGISRQTLCVIEAGIEFPQNKTIERLKLLVNLDRFDIEGIRKSAKLARMTCAEHQKKLERRRYNSKMPNRKSKGSRTVRLPKSDAFLQTLVECRLKKNLTMRKVAEAIGASLYMVWSMENGEAFLKGEQLEKLENLYGIKVDNFELGKFSEITRRQSKWDTLIVNQEPQTQPLPQGLSPDRL